MSFAISYADCSDVKCENGGSCSDIPGGFRCECDGYHYGDLCEFGMR